MRTYEAILAANQTIIVPLDGNFIRLALGNKIRVEPVREDVPSGELLELSQNQSVGGLPMFSSVRVTDLSEAVNPIRMEIGVGTVNSPEINAKAETAPQGLVLRSVDVTVDGVKKLVHARAARRYLCIHASAGNSGNLSVYPHADDDPAQNSLEIMPGQLLMLPIRARVWVEGGNYSLNSLDAEG